MTENKATTKDSHVHSDGSESVEFVPVTPNNSPQPISVNMIIAALGGGANRAVEYPDDGDKIKPIEGWVPPSNRNGTTGFDDPLLAKDKVARLHVIDSAPDLSPNAGQLDPRDNRVAPDTW